MDNVVLLKQDVRPCYQCEFCTAEDANYRYAVCNLNSSVRTTVARSRFGHCGVFGLFFMPVTRSEKDDSVS